MVRYKELFFVFLICVFVSCNLNNSQSSVDKTQNIYYGWWVYGDGQHIFKDEETLQEFEMVFLNENIDELVELYLAVCEMEYYPLECSVTAFSKENTLQIKDFEIMYIEGCED